MFKEFKEFALRGNVIDLAVGIIIGGAFGKIVSSLVNDIMMPPLGWLMSVGADKLDFTNMFYDMTHTGYANLAEAQAAGAPTINYGLFITNIINFTLVAFAVFLLVKQINRLHRQAPPPAAPETKECPFCTSTISLKATRCPQCTSQLDVIKPRSAN